MGEVERLLQVVAVVRAGDGLPVQRESLIAKVEEYRTSSAGTEGVNKMITRDQERLAELGIVMENVAPPGMESAYVLRDGAWRLPIELSDLEQGLLALVMAAAGAAGAEANPLSTAPDDLSSMLGHVPRSLDIAQAAIAGSRKLLIERAGEEQEFTPAMLASRMGRWFLLGCFEGEDTVKAPRLDRMEVLGLGEPARLPHVDDPEVLLDPTAWGDGDRLDAEVRCASAALESVRSWFPRAEVSDLGDGTVALRFWVRNEGNLVDRVIGLGGSAWITAPASSVALVRERAQAVLEGIAT